MTWTRCVVELSEAEEVTLQQLSINQRRRDTRTRAAGVLMLGREQAQGDRRTDGLQLVPLVTLL